MGVLIYVSFADCYGIFTERRYASVFSAKILLKTGAGFLSAVMLKKKHTINLNFT